MGLAALSVFRGFEVWGALKIMGYQGHWPTIILRVTATLYLNRDEGLGLPVRECSVHDSLQGLVFSETVAEFVM